MGLLDLFDALADEGARGEPLLVLGDLKSPKLPLELRTPEIFSVYPETLLDVAASQKVVIDGEGFGRLF